jgi:hypothetical protein
MAETTILRNSAINRNFAKPSAPAATSEPGQAGQGPLPTVKVHMTGTGPQLVGGQTVNPVTLTPARDTRRVVHSGLPMVQVKMGRGAPQVQQVPQVMHAASAAPRPQAQQVQQVQVAEPELSNDQLLLCRHLADKYLTELRASTGEPKLEGASDYEKLAEVTIAAIDAVMEARTIAEAAAMLPEPAPQVQVLPQVGVANPPRVVVGSRSGSRNAAATPRRVARPAGPSTGPGAPLPVVAVQMQGGRAVPVAQPAAAAPIDPATVIDPAGDGGAE